MYPIRWPPKPVRGRCPKCLPRNREADIGFAEVVPADDGGEGEEVRQTASNCEPKPGKALLKRQLGNCCAGFAGQVGIGQQDNQRGCRADHQRIDKNTDKRGHTLLHRVFDVGGRVSVRGRNPYRPHWKTGRVPRRSGLPRAYRYRPHRPIPLPGLAATKIPRNIGIMWSENLKQNNHGTQDVNYRHKRHDKLRDTGNAVDTADDDQAGEYRQSNADSHRRNIESQIHGRGDGIGLGCVADETQRDNQGDGEKAGQETRRATADFRVRPCVM